MEMNNQYTGCKAGEVLAQFEQNLKGFMADILGGPKAIEQGYSAKVEYSNFVKISVILAEDEQIALMTKMIILRKLENAFKDPMLAKWGIVIEHEVTVRW